MKKRPPPPWFSYTFYCVCVSILFLSYNFHHKRPPRFQRCSFLKPVGSPRLLLYIFIGIKKSVFYCFWERLCQTKEKVIFPSFTLETDPHFWRILRVPQPFRTLLRHTLPIPITKWGPIIVPSSPISQAVICSVSIGETPSLRASH